MTRVLLIAIFAMFCTSSAFAADAFLVAKNKDSGKCVVTKHKPNSAKWTLVGTASYQTHKEAKAAMKAAPECK